MLFFLCFGLLGLTITITGFLMFALPDKYEAIINWYLTKTGLRRRPSTKNYSRWASRFSGFMLFLVSFLIYYALWLQLR